LQISHKKARNKNKQIYYRFIYDQENLVVVAYFAFLLNWFVSILRALRGYSGSEKGFFEKCYYLLLLLLSAIIN
jgi:hypothetical protein